MNPYLDENELGKTPEQLKVDYKLPVIQKKKHANQLLTDAIIEVVEDKNYKKWIMRVARSKKSPEDILDILEVAKKLEPKYNKSGYVWKRL